MAPKKKGKKNAEVAESGIDNADEAELKAMRTKAKELSKEIEREARDFNEYQQQREKLNYFWIVEKKNLEDKKAELRNKDREMQDLEEKHQVEIKVYKQRLKHLLHEFQNELTLKRTTGEMTLKIQQDENRGSEADLKADRRSLRIELKEMELSHEEFLKSLKLDQDKKIARLRKEFERKASEVQSTYEKKMESARLELEEKRKLDTQTIEQQKNEHIATLMDNHKKAFAEIKNYYNDITHNNLDLIKSLKEEVAEMREKEILDEKQMESISLENKRMSEPFKQAQKDLEHLRAELDRYEQEKEELRETKASLLMLEDDFRRLSWEHEVEKMRFTELVGQRDELRDRFEATVFETQQKAGFRNLLLEKKLKSAHEVLETKEAQLNELLARANLDGPSHVRSKVDDLLQMKNQEVLDLQSAVERVATAQQQMSAAVSRKLGEYGIPIEELGFTPQGL